MFSTNSVDPTAIEFKTEFDIVSNPRRLYVRDTLLSLRITATGLGSISEEECMLAYALGIRVACTHFDLTTDPPGAELGVVMDTLLRTRYPRVTFAPARVTVSKRMDPHTCLCIGGTIEVHAHRWCGKVTMIQAKI